MHSAVMQNADYIKFASQNTVEVLCLGGLDQGVAKNDKKAATYKTTVDGKEVELMVSWPNLTFDEIVALHQSKANQYNKTGGIPYTAIVDPHDLSEMWSHSGGTSAGTIQVAIEAAKQKLEKAHGKGVTRKDYKAFVVAETAATRLASEGEYSKAIAEFDTFKKSVPAWPQELKARYEVGREGVIESARKRLAEIEEAGVTDPVVAKRDLDKLMLKLSKTGLEADAKALAQSLATGN
jgi:hypothetical protein